MEDSFFEYRDNTGAHSESDSEIIDNSLVVDVPFSAKKKNHTVFVAESEESTDDENERSSKVNLSKSVVRRSSVAGAHIISSSDEDASRKGSIRRNTNSGENLVLSSSDDDGSSGDDEGLSNDNSPSQEEASPELIPKRRPPFRPKSIDSNDESIIVRKTKKRVFLIDSDTDNDNSIVIEHKKHNKLKCLKDTPLKIENKNVARHVDKSMDYEDVGDESDVGDVSENETNISKDQSLNKTDVTKHDISNVSFKNDDSKNNTFKNDDESKLKDDDYSKDDNSEDDNFEDNDSKGDDDEGPDEDLMVMSRATRMSIMGVMPKDDESDDSDYIQSDESSRKSKDIAAHSLSDLPDPGIPIHKTPEKAGFDGDTSRLTCSPFNSPLHDITNELNKSSFNQSIPDRQSRKSSSIELEVNVGTAGSENFKLDDVIDLSNVEVPVKMKGRTDDDDVRIIDTKPEIIALSSDDEEVVEKSPRRVSPKAKKTPTKRDVKPDIKKYMLPASAPNQVVYVKKSVRENEVNKLNRLKEDLKSVRLLLNEMDLDSLPDGGSKLVERLSGLESQVRQQGDRVASMIVEPDDPSAQDIANDGFEKGLSWEDIQRANNAVQPRMFGKQAMATHMAERNLIIDRLRDLHSSLESRPSESTLARAPRLIASQMMKHQLHALAWLQWRETQRPPAGILADDMGLGKTITMISLMASDKEGKIDHDDEDEDGSPAKGKLVRGGTLVVCPASLIQQWASEVTKHCTAHALSVTLHHGAARAAQPHRLAAHDLVATTYNILQRDSEKNGVLMRVRWRRVILDEAHIVRNHKSATSAAVCALRAARRWCLTGTPVQNKDLDLFALLKFLRVSPFDELQMWKKWVDNKSAGGQERLSTVMQSILLRRTKVQLQERGELNCLPSRTAHHTEVTLTPHEMNVYQKVLVLSKSLFAQFLHQRAEKNTDSTSFAAKQQDSEYFKMHKKMVALHGVTPVKSHEILVLLLRLRQVCCHCGLIAAMLDEETAAAPADAASEDLLQELDKLTLHEKKSKDTNQEEEDGEPEMSATATEAIRAVLSPNNPVFKLSLPSSKINAVMDVLNNNVFCNKGDKAVVVSQWTSVLRLVEAELTSRRVRSVTLSGAVPVPARPALIDALNDPNTQVKVMLLSLCAGGVGINLTGASHLLLLDPHWNPQLEQQAQDRVYRVGQKKDVHIYRFMCVGTVEETIRKLQDAKLKLAENVLTGARNNAASTLSIEDLKMLFNMGTTQ